MKKRQNYVGEQGLIKWVLVIIVAIILASYFFDFSVQETIEDEQTQENFGYISENVSNFWSEHLADPANYLWNDVFLGLIWSAFTANMENLQNGENTIFEDSAPGVDLGNINGIGKVGGVITGIEELRNASSVVNKPITTGLTGKAKDYVDTMTSHIEIKE